MRSEQVYNFLINRGYTFYEPHSIDNPVVVANYYRIDRTRNVPDCISNDKPPQFAIQDSYVAATANLPEYRAFRIGITNEAPQGWIDFHFYGLTPTDILTRLDEFEDALLEVWKRLFEIDSKHMETK